MKEGLARYPRYREATMSDRGFGPRDVQVMAKTWDQARLFRFLAGQEREHKLRVEAAYERQILQEN